MCMSHSGAKRPRRRMHLAVAAQSSLRSDCAATGKPRRYAHRSSALLRLPLPSESGRLRRTPLRRPFRDCGEKIFGFAEFFPLRPKRRRGLPVSEQHINK